MCKVVQAPYTLWLLLCVAGSSWGSTADESAVTESTVAKTAFQDLTASATATKPTVPGFTPYPQFIDGQTPTKPDPPPHEVAGRCSAARQCSTTAEQLEVLQGPATSASSGDAGQHAAQPATQQPAQQQQASSTVHQQHTEASAAPAPTAQPQAATAASPEAQQQVPAQEPTAAAPTTPAVLQQKQPPPPPVRPLLNLALLSDGASVLAANAEARRPERAIDKDIDSFMKNDCNADKWVIIELSQLGTVETVKLTMKELYSSRVNTFRVFGRSSHPRKDSPDLTASINSEAWQLLGTFTAENKRGTQSFTLPQRSRVRYVLLRFDTHYGSEAMCALNTIQVLGVSAAQELEEALAQQEEIEAEELFQHLQQQHEEQEQMQQQLHPPPPGPLHQQLQQPAVPANHNGDHHHVPLDTNDSASATVSQQSQQDGRIAVVDVMGVHSQEGQQQLATQPAASSTASPQQKAAAVDNGMGPTSQGLSASTGVQQQQPAATPDALAAATDQDIIAVPVVPEPTTQPVASLGQSAQQPDNQQQPEAVESPAGVASIPAGAASISLSSNGSPSSPTADHVADGAGHQHQQAVAPAQAAPAQAASPAQLTAHQQSHPAVVQPAEQTLASVPATPAAAQPLGGGGGRTEVEANGQASASPAGDGPTGTAGPSPAVPVGVATAAGPTATNGHTPLSSGQPVVISAAAPASAPVRPASSHITALQQSPAPQQLPTAAAPVQQQPPQKQSSREPVLAGGTAKPKQAGNLFDIIKSEMMQLKLEQGKVSKKLEGLSKRGSEADAVALQLQEQQVLLMDRLEKLTSKVDTLADQLSRAEVLYQYHTQQHGHQHHAAGGMQGGMDPLSGIPHSHRGHQHQHGVHVASGTSPAGPQHMPVCQGEVIAVPLMLQSRYMWGVVGWLAGSAVLGLLVLFLHPVVSKMSSAVKVVIFALALVNLVLAVLLCMYLLLEGLLVRYQQAFRREYVFDTFVTVPQHRMLTNGSR